MDISTFLYTEKKYKVCIYHELEFDLDALKLLRVWAKHLTLNRRAVSHHDFTTQNQSTGRCCQLTKLLCMVGCLAGEAS